MAALPYIQLYVADYLADTAHLSTTQHGAYLLLIMNYWQRGQPFKAKDQRTLSERLAMIARMTSDEWVSAEPVIAEFFEVTQTEWRHHRIEQDLAVVRAKSTKARASAAVSVNNRRNRKPANAERTLSERSTNAERTLSHTDTDTDADAEKETTAEAVVVAAVAPTPSDDALSSSASALHLVKPPCPYTSIVNLYHEILPELPTCKVLTDARKGFIKQRWTQKPGPSLDKWRDYFSYVRKCPWLMGQVPGSSGRPPFVANLEWLTRPSNFAKVWEGNYETYLPQGGSAHG